MRLATVSVDDTGQLMHLCCVRQTELRRRHTVTLALVLVTGDRIAVYCNDLERRFR